MEPINPILTDVEKDVIKKVIDSADDQAKDFIFNGFSIKRTPWTCNALWSLHNPLEGKYALFYKQSKGHEWYLNCDLNDEEKFTSRLMLLTLFLIYDGI